MMIAEVIVEVSNAEVDKVFDYKIPNFFAGKNLRGYRVLVPFGPRKIEGYIINQKKESKVAPEKLKEILKVIDENQVILPEMLDLMKFMVDKFYLKKVDILRLFIPSEMRGNKVKPLFLKGYKLNKEFNLEELEIFKNAKRQQEIIEYIKEKRNYSR